MIRCLPSVAVAAALLLPIEAAAASRGAPVVLPGDAGVAGVRAAERSWIVGARPSRVAVTVARRYGALGLGGGAYVVRRDRARSLAAALRRHGALAYAEPDRLARAAQAPAPDPLSPLAGWRDVVVEPDLEPPAVTARSPLLALVSTAVDLSHPEFQGSRVTSLDGAAPVTDSSGTAVASVAAAPVNGVGIVGIWPGMRAVSSPLPGATGDTCSQVTRRLRSAIDAGAAVIHMGYGFSDVSGEPGSACFSQYAALQDAVRRGVILIASAGMRLASGERLDEPASLPHVITVAAVNAERRPASFSLASNAVDLAAPGEQVLAAVPLQFDRGGNEDGYRTVSGTALSAAMAAAAAAWIVAEDPSLTPDQVAYKLRKSARDLEPRSYDSRTGWGLLQVGAALEFDPPAPDPREPNDDIGWVDGRELAPGQPSIWSGGRSRTITARLDRFEDPADVYVVRIPAHSSILVRVRPHVGDPSLSAYDQGARRVEQRSERLGRSQRRGGRTESLLVRNASRRRRTVYLHAYVDRAAQRRDASYALTIRRGPSA